MANKQPFYHSMTVIFTGTEDYSDVAKTPEFLEKLERFLKKNLGPVVKGSVEMDSVDAEPGDPSDLM
jgi:hypothetical protein